MARAHEARVDDLDERLDLAIVSADDKRAMVEHARALKRARCPDLGRSESRPARFSSGDELVELIDGAAGYVVNDYEWSLTLEQTGCHEDEIAARCGAVVITRGAEGSEDPRGRRGAADSAGASAERVVDPDRLRRRLPRGLPLRRARGYPFEVAGRMGSLLGSLQVAPEGPQSLRLDPGAFAARYEREFGLRSDGEGEARARMATSC